jgi:hypothetical protein
MILCINAKEKFCAALMPLCVEHTIGSSYLINTHTRYGAGGYSTSKATRSSVATLDVSIQLLNTFVNHHISVR